MHVRNLRVPRHRRLFGSISASTHRAQRAFRPCRGQDRGSCIHRHTSRVQRSAPITPFKSASRCIISSSIAVSNTILDTLPQHSSRRRCCQGQKVQTRLPRRSQISRAWSFGRPFGSMGRRSRSQVPVSHVRCHILGPREVVDSRRVLTLRASLQDLQSRLARSRPHRGLPAEESWCQAKD